MPSNFTEHYQLNQWEPEDAVRRVDFNEDNAKIDAAIKAQADALAAEASTREALAGQVAKLGNCLIQTASYIGEGTGTSSSARSLTFSGKPYLVVICGPASSMVLVNGVTSGLVAYNGGGYENKVSWKDHTVTWYCTDTLGAHMMNASGSYKVESRRIRQWRPPLQTERGPGFCEVLN